MKISRLMALAILTVFAAPSMAATFHLGSLGPPGSAALGNTFYSTGPFTDLYHFTINAGANVSGVAAEFETSPLWNFLSADLSSVSLGGGWSVDNTPNSFSFNGLSAGSYILTVRGNVSTNWGIAALGTGYTGRLTATATAVPPRNDVPEPATLALLGISMLGLGFAKRRKAS
jgi:hypothetical protein